MKPGGIARPGVSVCIAAFNGAAFIASAIESVLGQTHRDLELLIADDASSDATVRIAESYAKADSRVRVMSNPTNLGPIGNRNLLLQHAGADWIKILPQDDQLHRECLEVQLAEAHARGAMIVGCHRSFLFEDADEDTRRSHLTSRARAEQVFAGGPLSPRDVAILAVREGATENWFGEPPVALIHRSVFDRVGGFDPGLVQIPDLEFWIRAGIHFGLAFVDRELVIFRVHGKSVSAGIGARRRFRRTRLDPLALMCRCMVDPLYEPLRIIAEYEGLWDDFCWRFWEQTRVARREVKRAPADARAAILKEWSDFLEHYPAVADMSWLRLLARYPAALRTPIRKRLESALPLRRRNERFHRSP